MSNMEVRLAAIVFAILPNISCAEAPPVSPVEAITWPQNYSSKPAYNIRLGTLRLELEESTLPAIQKAIGAGQVEHQGDASESTYWLCYSTGSFRVWLLSNAEMGGDDHALTGLSAQSLSQGNSEDCPSLPARFRAASIDRGLWVGMPESEFSGALVNPSHVQGAWRMYDYSAKIAGNGQCVPSGYDLLNWLRYRVEGGQVVEIQAGQVTSC